MTPGSEVYKTFLQTRTLSTCSTEYNFKTRGYKSFVVRSLLSTIWSMLQRKVNGIIRTTR